MTFKKIDIEITGTTPLLMHKIGKATIEQMKKRGRKISDIPTPEAEAEDACYRNSRKELFIPARCIKACIVTASSWYKIGRRSLKQFIAGTVRIEPYEVLLGTKRYEIDARPVVIGRGNRVIRHRPILKKWKCKFNLIYNDEIFNTPDSLRTLRKVVEEAGMRCGLLDNRAQRGGDNGSFKITKWRIGR